MFCFWRCYKCENVQTSKYLNWRKVCWCLSESESPLIFIVFQPNTYWDLPGHNEKNKNRWLPERGYRNLASKSVGVCLYSFTECLTVKLLWLLSLFFTFFLLFLLTLFNFDHMLSLRICCQLLASVKSVILLTGHQMFAIFWLDFQLRKIGVSARLVIFLFFQKTALHLQKEKNSKIKRPFKSW